MGASRRLRRTLGAFALGAGAAALYWRRNPSACPYGQRFWVEAPHPFITRARLLEALEPEAGERVLEVGPGTGYYSLTVAERLAPAGTLEIFDLQQEMLDHTLRRAGERGITNVAATKGDARGLPYPDASFDAAYLVAVLGEIPERERALAELRRVLKPGARLVVGEIFGDPHWVSPGRLEAEARAAGLEPRRQVGRWYGYFAVLGPA
jgi:ubiquinone/menaquinone biosynthesis C-methylase UbiE